MHFEQTTLNCRGKLADLSAPVVMGILNVTPDSFYDGGRYQQLDQALFRAAQMLSDGAWCIDIGGMSSRPGAEILEPDTEWKRVGPVIEAVARHFPEALISIDTVHGTVARRAVDAGAALINDVSAGRIDPDILDAAAALRVPYVLMHMQGKPESMQENPRYENIVLDILDFFIRELGRLRALGIEDIILDPGFGFGKTLQDNYRLLGALQVFKVTGLPLMVGLSRKSMVFKALGTGPEDALNGTTALHFAALQQGARILRAHDVRAAAETIKLWQLLENESQWAQ
jgi:dihydropteroate synthase